MLLKLHSVRCTDYVYKTIIKEPTTLSKALVALYKQIIKDKFGY
jgi:hypothetical protein